LAMNFSTVGNSSPCTCITIIIHLSRRNFSFLFFFVHCVLSLHLWTSLL
jgi:hypothetical protein